jgi:Rps23 Pro-64 3,4-dihydroxylase Tpa1-like proline 4-hydroxylase
MLEVKSEEEIQTYKNIFEKERKVNISNLLQSEEIEKIHRFLNRLLPSFWVCATCIKKDRLELPMLDKRNIKRIQMTNEAFGRGEFAYHFYRTFNSNPLMYSPIEHQVRTFFSSQLFINFLNRITHLELTQLNTLFVSKYVSNSFLSTHSDAGNGKLAFVLHLTKEWKPQYGGHLHFLNQDRTKIVETYTPQFNHLMIFEVPEGEGIPHFVGHVAPNVSVPRISITGWFQ